MILENAKQFPSMIFVPHVLQGKIEILTNTEVTPKEVALFNDALRAIGSYIADKKINLMDLFTLNVFFTYNGTMSFVGYRPVCLTEVELNRLRGEYGVFAARPGLTGLAQVSGRDNLEFEEKAKLDAYYVQNRSIKMDLWCLFRTVVVSSADDDEFYHYLKRVRNSMR